MQGLRGAEQHWNLPFGSRTQTADEYTSALARLSKFYCDSQDESTVTIDEQREDKVRPESSLRQVCRGDSSRLSQATLLRPTDDTASYPKFWLSHFMHIHIDKQSRRLKPILATILSAF